MFVIPDDFVRERIANGGASGAAWIDRLPAILATCELEWGLTIHPPFDNLSFNYVAPAVRSDGTTVVVKVCLPDAEEFAHEADALRHFAGNGMVQLLEHDRDNGVILLEYLRPGTPLYLIEDDEKMTSIAAAIMRRLWRPVPAGHSFPSILKWGKGFTRLRQHYGGGNGPFPPALLEEAETLFAELGTSMEQEIVLHGDLHHENILAAEREPWLAIDPKGVTGEPAYEVGTFLRNLDLNRPHPGRLLARRVDQLVEELGFDRARVRGWGLAQTVLSVWWGIEDSGRVSQEDLRVAELLAAIKV